MKHILFVGGTGHIGSYLEKKLKYKNIKFIGTKDCDLTSINSIEKYFKNSIKVDTLVFLVGLAHNKGKRKDFNKFNSINYVTLCNLLSFLEKKNNFPKKIIYSSTVSVYGENYYKDKFDEMSSTNPFSPYAITKLKAEKFLIKNYTSYTWIMRFAPVYSEEFLLNINRRTKIKNLFFQVSNGLNKLSLCNLFNIKVAIEGVIDDFIPAGVYNISDNIVYSYKDLLKLDKVSFVIRIPRFFIKTLYFYGKLFNNIFLKENTIKLLSDNIYPSDKIRDFIELPENLHNIETYSD